MCFDYDSSPPELPADLVVPAMAGGAAAELLELTSADGTRFSAALAEAPDGSAPGIVILPDVRGLYRFYVELAERFAQAGHSAIAIDYFGRTAGTGERDDDWDYMPHVMQTRVDQVQADALAALEALRERTGVTAAATVGFCFGGSQSFAAATSAELGLDRVVGFYGSLRRGARARRRRSSSPRGCAARCSGSSAAPTRRSCRTRSRRSSALQAGGVEHDIHVYPGAPHSFFDRKYDEYADACEDAWRRTLQFLAA